MLRFTTCLAAAETNARRGERCARSAFRAKLVSLSTPPGFSAVAVEGSLAGRLAGFRNRPCSRRVRSRSLSGSCFPCSGSGRCKTSRPRRGRNTAGSRRSSYRFRRPSRFPPLKLIYCVASFYAKRGAESMGKAAGSRQQAVTCLWYESALLPRITDSERVSTACCSTNSFSETKRSSSRRDRPTDARRWCSGRRGATPRRAGGPNFGRAQSLRARGWGGTSGRGARR